MTTLKKYILKPQDPPSFDAIQFLGKKNFYRKRRELV